jgi:tRNA (cytidine/uridine-2'-O-)-methyltransferase
MFNIVLVEPKIPPNTGSIGRLCVNLGAKLHLIEPLGFDISQKSLRRAGLDYWDRLELTVWKSFDDFLKINRVNRHFHLATTKSDRIYWDVNFYRGDFLMFGSETEGLREEFLLKHSENTITIPMSSGGRSLNLSISVGIVAYEALRQILSRRE